MIRQKIILLSGFGGTGKTTVAGRLYDLLECNALVEADDLFHIKPFVIGEQMGRIKLKNTLNIMRNFVLEGYPYIICVGLVWSQAELDAVLQEFPSDQYDHYLIWLSADKEMRFQRVITRAEPGDTREWLEQVERTIQNPWPFINIADSRALKIDTTNKSAEQVAKEIIAVTT